MPGACGATAFGGCAGATPSAVHRGLDVDAAPQRGDSGGDPTRVVAGLTGGIFDPMSIKATCASGGRAAAPGSPEIKVGDGATREEIIDVFQRAGGLSVESG